MACAPSRRGRCDARVNPAGRDEIAAIGHVLDDLAARVAARERTLSDQNAALLRRRAAVARSYCSDALDHVASETVQLHGGIAITWEHDAQLLFKRAHVLSRLWDPAHVARASVIDA